MRKHDSRQFVMQGPGTSLLKYSFDEERKEMTVTCPGCQCSYVASAQPGVREVALEHEHDCPWLALIESFGNQGVLHGK